MALLLEQGRIRHPLLVDRNEPLVTFPLSEMLQIYFFYAVFQVVCWSRQQQQVCQFSAPMLFNILAYLFPFPTYPFSHSPRYLDALRFFSSLFDVTTTLRAHLYWACSRMTNEAGRSLSAFQSPLQLLSLHYCYLLVFSLDNINSKNLHLTAYYCLHQKSWDFLTKLAAPSPIFVATHTGFF